MPFSYISGFSQDEDNPQISETEKIEIKAFKNLCDTAERDSKATWIIDEIINRLKSSSSHYGSQNEKYPIMIFEREFTCFSLYLIKHPSVELINFYSNLNSGALMGETKTVTLAKIMTNNPEIFFSWNGCVEFAEHIMHDEEGIAFLSIDEWKLCIENLEKYLSKKPEKAALIRKTIENLKLNFEKALKIIHTTK